MPKDQPGQFLGGGFKFNSVGNNHATPSDDTSPNAGDTGPILVPNPVKAVNSRTLLIIVAVIVLVGVLYFVDAVGLGGVTRTQGHGSPVSPTDHPSEPPSNF